MLLFAVHSGALTEPTLQHSLAQNGQTYGGLYELGMNETINVHSFLVNFQEPIDHDMAIYTLDHKDQVRRAFLVAGSSRWHDYYVNLNVST